MQRIISIAQRLTREDPARGLTEEDVRKVLLVSDVLYVYDPAHIRRLFSSPGMVTYLTDEYDSEACSIVLHDMEHGHGQGFATTVKAVFDHAFAEDYDPELCLAWAASIATALDTGRAEYNETVLAALESRTPIVITVDEDAQPQGSRAPEEEPNAGYVSDWIGVDLDGTLAEYTGWQGFEQVGPAIAPMLERVRTWLAEGRRVKLFTARAAAREIGCRPIRRWLHENGLRELEVTNIKDMNMTELWDDRCISVGTNTGQPCCSGPQPSKAEGDGNA